MDKQIDGSITFPYWENSEVVNRFLDTVHELNIAPNFDWVNWEEGRNILQNKQQDYEHLKTITLCKLLTSIIRADRFSDGFLVGNFENGVIAKIVLSLKHKVQTSSV